MFPGVSTLELNMSVWLSVYSLHLIWTPSCLMCAFAHKSKLLCIFISILFKKQKAGYKNINCISKLKRLFNVIILFCRYRITILQPNHSGLLLYYANLLSIRNRKSIFCESCYIEWRSQFINYKLLRKRGRKLVQPVERTTTRSSKLLISFRRLSASLSFGAD